MAGWKLSIGKKLLLGIGVPGLLLAITGLDYFWRKADRAVLSATREEALAVTELLASTFALAPAADVPLTDPHRPVREALRANWQLLRNVEAARVVDAQGQVVWSRNVEEEGKPAPDAAALTSADREQVLLRGRSAEAIRPLGGMACAGCHTGGNALRVGALQLVVREPALQDEVSSVFGRALFGVGIFAILMAGVTALAFQLFLRRPLRKLSKVMRQAEEGDFLVRAEVIHDDELGRLSQAFNSMLARITSMKAEEIDTHRDLAAAQAELSLKKQIEKRVAELSLLYDISRSLTATLELPKIFVRVSSLVAERLQIPQFSIMLVTPEHTLEVKAAYPKGQGSEGQCFKMGEGAAGHAAQTLEPVYVRDLESAEDPRYQRRTATGPARGSLLCIPMVHKNALLGILNLERPEPNAFPPEEQDLLRAVAALVAMATKNALLHEETVALSLTDPLTGAYNRRHLFNQLEREVERAQRFDTPLSVLMVDIDHFKQLNDTAGHRAGDEVLRKVSDLIRGQVRKLDTVARYGGEEFLVVLPGIGKPEAVEVAEKLRRVIAETVFEHGRTQPLGLISISVGAASMPKDARRLEQLVDCADSALYASKRAGRNTATGYEPGMELHPGRERGPHAAKRRATSEIPIIKTGGQSG